MSHSSPQRGLGAEARRLAEDERRSHNWKRWGPYLSERQWGTVREDYSPDGMSWTDFPHEYARSRAYRWGEDGLLGITDRQCRLCFSLALWNERDPFLKERLFGLAGPQGNHGEDVKEEYFYLDSTPTHSYLKALYKYPQAEFPYARLVEENQRRGREETEFELVDTGIFDGQPLLRRLRRVRQGGPGGSAHPHHRGQPGAASRRASTCCPRSGSATPGPGAGRVRATGPGRACPPWERTRSSPSRTRWGATGSTRRCQRAERAPSGCSPRTRRTSSGSTGCPTASAT